MIGSARPAHAWLRAFYEDDELVARSELIVVGGIKDGSLQFMPQWHKPGEAIWWEHRAMLTVHRVLKGKTDQQEIPIVIHYGLEPKVGDQRLHDGDKAKPAPPTGAIAIYDSGNSVISLRPLVPDARADNIWFLRRLGGYLGREKKLDADLGILDPEDLQPLAMEDYIRCYLSDDPEAAVRKHLAVQPAVAARAVHYLQRREVQRILQIADPAERVERLLPYFDNRAAWRAGEEAGRGIIATGSVAGPYLLGLYLSNADPNARQAIVHAWAAMRWSGCVDLLIEQLKDDDKLWSREKLEPGWWNQEPDSGRTERRRTLYSEVYTDVYALGQIGDPRAREAIDLTRHRWAAIPFENSQLVEECDHALQRFARIEAKGARNG
jgi:hypothetical protein